MRCKNIMEGHHVDPIIGSVVHDEYGPNDTWTYEFLERGLPYTEGMRVAGPPPKIPMWHVWHYQIFGTMASVHQHLGCGSEAIYIAGGHKKNLSSVMEKYGAATRGAGLHFRVMLILEEDEFTESFGYHPVDQR